MKRTTCNLLVGSLITGIVIFLLGVDVTKIRKNLSAHHITKSEGFSKAQTLLQGKSLQVNDRQALNLIEKRLEKLEKALYELISNVKEANKQSNVKKQTEELKKVVIVDKLSEKKDINKGELSKKEPENKDKLPIILSPLNNMKQTGIPVTSVIPKFNFHKMLVEDNSQTKGFNNMGGLINFDDIHRYLINESEKKSKSKTGSNFETKSDSLTNDNIFMQEIDILEPVRSPNKEMASTLKDDITKFDVEIKEDKKPNGFITKSRDEALPSSDKPTDFTVNHHPFFFTEKIKNPSTSLPSLKRDKNEDHKKFNEALDKIFKRRVGTLNNESSKEKNESVSKYQSEKPGSNISSSTKPKGSNDALIKKEEYFPNASPNVKTDKLINEKSDKNVVSGRSLINTLGINEPMISSSSNKVPHLETESVNIKDKEVSSSDVKSFNILKNISSKETTPPDEKANDIFKEVNSLDTENKLDNLAINEGKGMADDLKENIVSKGEKDIDKPIS